MSTRIASLPLPAFVLFAASAAGQGATPQQPVTVYPTAVEAKGAGVKLMSLYDENAPAIRELAPGEILIAHGEKAGWVQVEVPGGFPCWVFGQYVDETGELGIAIVKSDRVNLRAIPSSEKNYPIGQVNKGDQLRVLDHKGDWVKVLAPSSIHAYVKASSTTVLGDPARVRQRIQELEAAAEAQWKERLALLERQREEQKRRAEAKAAFDTADAALMQEKAKAVNADFSRVRAMLSEASRHPGADEGIQAKVKDRIDLIEALEALIREKAGAAELERRSKEMEEKLRGAREKALEEAQERIRFSDPDRLRGRYDGAGWLKRSLSLTRGNVYTLEKGGITLFEIIDPQGRYDLTDYLGHEIGVRGRTMRFPGATVQTIEITKLEVLAVPER